MGDSRHHIEALKSETNDSPPPIEFFAGWQPPERKPLTPPKGIELILGNGSTIDLSTSLDHLPKSKVTDCPLPNPVKGGVLELSYRDPDFDRKLNCGYDYQTLKITDMPPEVKLRHWIDDKGYFFWFPKGSDRESPHHYPRNLRVIEIDGQRQDVDLQRIQVSDAHMAKQTGLQTGFYSMGRSTNVLSYFRRMSEVSQSALNYEEEALRQGAQTSNNPYFRIYLSDVLVTQAMQPIIKGMTEGGKVDLGNPETIKKLDEAIEELRRAQKTSLAELQQGNRYPAGNVAPPLSPFLFYSDPYAFWGGSLYQAQRREAALVMVRGLIKSGAFSNIELPPALPPK